MQWSFERERLMWSQVVRKSSIAWENGNAIDGTEKCGNYGKFVEKNCDSSWMHEWLTSKKIHTTGRWKEILVQLRQRIKRL
jgi:hypothetical protein